MTSAYALERRIRPRHQTPDSGAWWAAVGIGQELLSRKARSYHHATAFLPTDLQQEVAILYAFCRIADDLADECGDAGALTRLEEELLGARRARPVVAALQQVAKRHGFPLSHARLLLDGVRMDLGPVRIENDAELLTYSYKVASTVGLMLSRTFGADDPAAAAFAIDLGLAMQLTNIVRDVREDAGQGRVYLPRTRLAAHGLSPEELIESRASREGVRAVCLEVLELADGYYRSAAEGLRFLPFRARVGVAVAQRLYASIGWRIRRTGHHPLDGRMVVPAVEKCGRVLEALGLALRAAIAPGKAVRHDGALHRLLEVRPDALGAHV